MNVTLHCAKRINRPNQHRGLISFWRFECIEWSLPFYT